MGQILSKLSLKRARINCEILKLNMGKRGKFSLFQAQVATLDVQHNFSNFDTF